MSATPFKRQIFRAVLRDVYPMVIRLIAVPDSLDLSDFDDIFHAVLGWESGIGYAFQIHGQEFNSFQRKTRSQKLRDFRLHRQEKFLYTLGELDQWEWELRVVDLQDGADGDETPVCVGGRGAPPPPYSGGPTGYRLMLKRQQRGEQMFQPAQVESSIRVLAAAHPDRPASTWDILRSVLADGAEGSGANAAAFGDDGRMPRFVPVEELFKGRHFDREIVVLCVRWYLSFKLSYRDLIAMMSERGLGLAHTTILRWVQHYTPEFEKRWGRFARTVGGSWRMDETYIKVRGEWVYLYRAVDKTGKTVDFHLSRKRDVNAAKAFLRKAMKGRRAPTKITLDAYAASHRAVAELKGNGELPKRVPVRTSKYLNNLDSRAQEAVF